MHSPRETLCRGTLHTATKRQQETARDRRHETPSKRRTRGQWLRASRRRRPPARHGACMDGIAGMGGWLDGLGWMGCAELGWVCECARETDGTELLVVGWRERLRTTTTLNKPWAEAGNQWTQSNPDNPIWGGVCGCLLRRVLAAESACCCECWSHSTRQSAIRQPADVRHGRLSLLPASDACLPVRTARPRPHHHHRRHCRHRCHHHRCRHRHALCRDRASSWAEQPRSDASRSATDTLCIPSMLPGAGRRGQTWQSAVTPRISTRPPHAAYRHAIENMTTYTVDASHTRVLHTRHEPQSPVCRAVAHNRSR
ncbi:hypothetical protein BC831DRAFT_78105 [Entophlyctis helioformis]|nr:hypothetical protein BC831DRAFT_78105 [Entophlyctis helioformis]